MTWLHDVIVWLGGALVALAAAVGLGGNDSALQVQGYVEGEYVYVGAPVAGRLETLDVTRGARVAGSPPGTTRPRAWCAPRPISPISGKVSGRRRSSRSRRSLPRRKRCSSWPKPS